VNERTNGLRNWASSDELVTTYFQTSQITKKVCIVLIGEAVVGTSEILVQFAGQEKSFTISGGSEVSLGQWSIDSPGY